MGRNGGWSYRGRVLVASNLAASTLWHRFMVLEPPICLVREFKEEKCRCLLDRGTLDQGPGSILSNEGRRTRPDGSSKPSKSVLNTNSTMATVSKRQIENMGYDKYQFSLELKAMDLSVTSSFYQYILRS